MNRSLFFVRGAGGGRRLAGAGVCSAMAAAAAVGSGLMMTSCGQGPSSSTPSYAHRPANGLMGTPLALARYHNAGVLPGEFPPVCIDNRSATITDAEVRLEVQLAFAAWWHAAGADEALWNKLRFDNRESCPSDGSVLAAIVVPAPGAGANPESGGSSGRFNQPTYSCSLRGSSVSCGTNSMTLGWGGPASLLLSRRTSGDGVSVTRVAISSPARVVLSPYVDWQPLARSLRQGADGRGTPPGFDWDGALARLGASANPALSALVALGEELANRKVTAGADPVFRRILDDFARSGRGDATGVAYRPQIAMFSTLLHEVGHTFGIDHADNPSADSVTGTASGERVGTGPQARTDLAVMAYALPYFYLTEDDRAGMRSAAQEIPDRP